MSTAGGEDDVLESSAPSQATAAVGKVHGDTPAASSYSDETSVASDSAPSTALSTPDGGSPSASNGDAAGKVNKNGITDSLGKGAKETEDTVHAGAYSVQEPPAADNTSNIEVVVDDQPRPPSHISDAVLDDSPSTSHPVSPATNFTPTEGGINGGALHSPAPVFDLMKGSGAAEMRRKVSVKSQTSGQGAARSSSSTPASTPESIPRMNENLSLTDVQVCQSPSQEHSPRPMEVSSVVIESVQTDSVASASLSPANAEEAMNPLRALFHELDSENTGIIGHHKLLMALSRVLGRRDLAESDMAMMLKNSGMLVF